MPGFRMLEAQHMGMERLAIKIGERFAGLGAEQRCLGLEPRPIDAVAEQRVADMGKMHPNLMRPAGFEPAGQKARHRTASDTVVPLHHLPACHRVPAAFSYRHPVAGVGVAGDGRLDAALWPIWRTPYEGEIAALERAGPSMVGELGCKRTMGCIGFGDNEEAGSI